MNAYTWGWVGFGLYFAMLEGIALYQSGKAVGRGEEDPRDTLSEHLWVWFGINRKGTGVDRNVGAGARVRRIVLMGALAWLVVHLLGGGGIV